MSTLFFNQKRWKKKKRIGILIQTNYTEYLWDAINKWEQSYRELIWINDIFLNTIIEQYKEIWTKWSRDRLDRNRL